jgi:hypothetical protein
MARQVRNKMGWDEGSNNKIAEKTGLLRIIGNIVGINHHVNEYTNSMGYGRIEGFKTRPGFASVKEAEALLRRARTFQ